MENRHNYNDSSCQLDGCFYSKPCHRKDAEKLPTTGSELDSEEELISSSLQTSKKTPTRTAPLCGDLDPPNPVEENGTCTRGTPAAVPAVPPRHRS